MFDTDGLIIKPNSPSVSQPDGAPYGKKHVPEVKCGTLAERNKQYYNIGKQGGATEAITVRLACHHVVG